MAVIMSGDDSTQLRVDPVSKAARVTLYGTDGQALAVLLAGTVEITNDVGSPIPVSGSVTVANLPATQAVSGSVAVSNLPATQPVSGSVAVTGNVEVVNDVGNPLPVSGAVTVSNFPGTQPVSGSVSVSNLPATQPVSGTVAVSNLAATQTVAGTVAVSNLPATQAVSGTVNVATLPALPAGANAIGTVAVTNTVPTAETRSATLHVSATGLTGAAVTATLPAVAGQFHYITALEITAYSTAARVGAAAPVLVTSTNMAGNPAWTFATAAAIGTTDRYQPPMAEPLRAAANGTATTIVCPATVGALWRVNVSYLAAP